MACPHCGSTRKPHKNGRNKAGTQRYRCADCKRIQPTGNPIGRPRKNPGDTPKERDRLRKRVEYWAKKEAQK